MDACVPEDGGSGEGRDGDGGARARLQLYRRGPSGARRGEEPDAMRVLICGAGIAGLAVASALRTLVEEIVVRGRGRWALPGADGRCWSGVRSRPRRVRRSS